MNKQCHSGWNASTLFRFSRKSTPRRFPDGPRYSQDDLKTALNSPRHPTRRPKTPMDASKTPADLDSGASRPELLEVFTCKIVNIWIVWENFWKSNSYQITCHFIPEYVKRLFGFSVTMLLARWRVRRSAALWIYIYIYMSTKF